MKRLLILLVLFVNLQIILTETGVSVDSIQVSAQNYMSEWLPEVTVTAGYPKCPYCDEKVTSGPLSTHVEGCPKNPMNTNYCNKCGQSLTDDHQCSGDNSNYDYERELPGVTVSGNRNNGGGTIFGGGGGSGGSSSGGSSGSGSNSGYSGGSSSGGNSQSTVHGISISKLLSVFRTSIYNRRYAKGKCGYCLRGWKTIWQKAGLYEYAGTQYAKNFGAKLKEYGFEPIFSSSRQPTSSEYTPKIGDTRIWQPYPGQSSQAGHIDWWNGTNWVSDYVQQGKWYPGDSYRGVNYVIYR